MKDFRVYDEVELRNGGDKYYAVALPTMCVKRPKGAEARCRLLHKGCYQEAADKGDTYASNPLLINLKLLLIAGLQKNYKFNFYGVCTAFLDAEQRGEVCLRLPIESYPDQTMLWRIRKAMYGFKAGPKAWQQHFATMNEIGSKRLRTEPHVYYFPTQHLYIMSYVDDILTVGPQDSADWFCEELSRKLHIKQVGELQTNKREIASLVR